MIPLGVGRNRFLFYGYGQPAGRAILKKARMVSAIMIHMAIMSINAKAGECMPKKSIDHRKLKISWMKNKLRAGFDEGPASHTRQAAMAIMI